MATGLQHRHPWEQPADTIQEYGWTGLSCAASRQRHAQKGLSFFNTEGSQTHTHILSVAKCVHVSLVTSFCLSFPGVWGIFF